MKTLDLKDLALLRIIQTFYILIITIDRFMISTYLFKSSTMMLNNLSNLLGIGFIFIPPVYYSEAQPGSLSWTSITIPRSNVAGLIRSYTGLLPLSLEAMILRWSVLAVMTIVFVVLTSLKAKWREK